MGYRIIAGEAGLEATPASPGRVVIDDPTFRGYLANVPGRDWWARYLSAVPEQMRGRDFLTRYLGTTDDATTVDPERVYPVRAATQHGITESERVRQFRGLLPIKGQHLVLGQLMYQSHESYSSCGLGSDGTDRLVALVREAGPEMGLYGAKITGGGSGGTVAVLAERGMRRTVEVVAQRYAGETGRASAVYAGSSDGARAFGVRRLVPHPTPDARDN
jgi:L-arabinokinase